MYVRNLSQVDFGVREEAETLTNKREEHTMSDQLTGDAEVRAQAVLR